MLLGLQKCTWRREVNQMSHFLLAPSGIQSKGKLTRCLISTLAPSQTAWLSEEIHRASPGSSGVTSVLLPVWSSAIGLLLRAHVERSQVPGAGAVFGDLALCLMLHTLYPFLPLWLHCWMTNDVSSQNLKSLTHALSWRDTAGSQCRSWVWLQPLFGWGWPTWASNSPLWAVAFRGLPLLLGVVSLQTNRWCFRSTVIHPGCSWSLHTLGCLGPHHLV